MSPHHRYPPFTCHCPSHHLPFDLHRVLKTPFPQQKYRLYLLPFPPSTLTHNKITYPLLSLKCSPAHSLIPYLCYSSSLAPSGPHRIYHSFTFLASSPSVILACFHFVLSYPTCLTSTLCSCPVLLCPPLPPSVLSLVPPNTKQTKPLSRDVLFPETTKMSKCCTAPPPPCSV